MTTSNIGVIQGVIFTRMILLMLESRMSLSSVVFQQVEVAASGWSLEQRRPTVRCVFVLSKPQQWLLNPLWLLSDESRNVWSGFEASFEVSIF